MKTNIVNRLLNALFYLIGFFGVLILIYSAYDMIHHFSLYRHVSLLIKVAYYMCLYLLFYDWAVALPSGAKWKPSMVFVLFSMLSFPFSIAMVVIFPAVLISTIKQKLPLWSFFTTMGHLAAGVGSGWLLLHEVLKPHSLHSSFELLLMMAALILHFFVNRFLTMVILTYRKKNTFRINLRAVVRDVNWTYLCIYSLGLLLVMVDQVYRYLGSLATIIVIFSLFKSVGYYQKYRMIAKTVFIDGLTQAENRAAWELFKDEIPGSSLIGTLVMIDLDDFKGVNDTFGHAKGDEVLLEFVKQLQATFSFPHRLFRFGGDEFLLFVPHKEGEDRVIQKIIKATLEQKNRQWKTQGFPVSISQGMTLIAPPYDLTEALEEADRRMYEDKEERKAK